MPWWRHSCAHARVNTTNYWRTQTHNQSLFLLSAFHLSKHSIAPSFLMTFFHAILLTSFHPILMTFNLTGWSPFRKKHQSSSRAHICSSASLFVSNKSNIFLIHLFLFLLEEFYGTRYQNGSFSLINVGSGFSLPAQFFFSNRLQIIFTIHHTACTFACKFKGYRLEMKDWFAATWSCSAFTTSTCTSAGRIEADKLEVKGWLAGPGTIVLHGLRVSELDAMGGQQLMWLPRVVIQGTLLRALLLQGVL